MPPEFARPAVRVLPSCQQVLSQFERGTHLDVVGCIPDERVVTVERYDPFQYLQDLIGILDRIERF